MENEFEFSALPCRNKSGCVQAGINIKNSYDKDLATYIEMDRVLRGKIPFAFEVIEGPKVCILDGDTRKGMAQLVMVVRCLDPDVDVEISLMAVGFGPFTWPSFQN